MQRRSVHRINICRDAWGITVVDNKSPHGSGLSRSDSMVICAAKGEYGTCKTISGRTVSCRSYVKNSLSWFGLANPSRSLVIEKNAQQFPKSGLLCSVGNAHCPQPCQLAWHCRLFHCLSKPLRWLKIRRARSIARWVFGLLKARFGPLRPQI